MQGVRPGPGPMKVRHDVAWALLADGRLLCGPAARPCHEWRLHGWGFLISFDLCWKGPRALTDASVLKKELPGPTFSGFR